MPNIHLSAFGYEAEICPERGANLVSLTKPELKMRSLANTQILWMTLPISIPISGASPCCCPRIAFPAQNFNLRAGSMSFR